MPIHLESPSLTVLQLSKGKKYAPSTILFWKGSYYQYWLYRNSWQKTCYAFNQPLFSQYQYIVFSNRSQVA